MAIGFHVSNNAPKAKRRESLPPSEILLQFDGGDGISLHEATHNTIALGSSGTGKTSSVILPALHSLLRAGYAGLVVDIKGNFTEQAKALAKQHGREGDFVEFGTGKDATPVNILDGMGSRQAFDFLRVLAVTPFANQTSHLDWHLKGVRLAADCLELLRIMHAQCSDISADLGTLEQLVNNITLATSMFKYISKTLSAAQKKEHRDFLRRVNNDTFHICAQKENDPNKLNTYEEQVTWRLGAVRNALAMIRDAPGVLRNFAVPGAAGIDLARLIYDEGKVVVLRFGVATGGIGALLARHLLEAFYAATYQRGLTLPEGKRVFFVGDEAQDFLDLNPYNKNNDNTFTAKAREFRLIQVIGTQSVASLGSRGAGVAQINEYLNNFGNKLILFNDDPQTLHLAERFDLSFSFQDMGQGQCLAIHFDAEKHRPICTSEGLQQAHDAVKKLIPQCQPELGSCEPEMSLSSLEHIYEEMCQAQRKARQEESAKPTPQKQVMGRPDISKRKGHNIMFDAVMDNAVGGAQNKEEKTSGTGIPQVELPPTEFGRFVARNPTIFPKSNLEGQELPKGWLPLLEQGIAMLKAMELSVQIYGFIIHDGRLVVTGARSCTGLDILNELFVLTLHTCPVCGQRVEKHAPPEEFDSDYEDVTRFKAFTFCDNCLQKSGFALLAKELSCRYSHKENQS